MKQNVVFQLGYRCLWYRTTVAEFGRMDCNPRGGWLKTHACMHATISALGMKIDSIQKNTVEWKLTYDAHNETGPYSANETLCGIGEEYNKNRVCLVNFTAPRNMTPPILIHYGLTNFHQNHRGYYRSKDAYQLNGRDQGQDSISAEECQPLNKLGNITLNPCGLIANTFFNDEFALVGGKDAFGKELIMIEEGISWQSDLEYVFKQPDRFDKSICEVCDESCCLPTDSCTVPYVDKKTDECWRYSYPDDDTTQYLYETYPNIISPIEGVTNEHFIVWMRVAAQPDFRKLYGWIDQPILEGENLTFRINANYVVTRFRGSKTLIVSTTSIFGGRNPYFAPVFIWVGVFCFIAGTFFALKHTLRPRKLADPAYLHYKED
jgi:LEM3 (ligand-effect modulator 3) family / CDC50 family